MAKRVRDWFHLNLKASEEMSLIQQVPIDILDEQVESFKEALGKFVWADTIEGWEYWHKLYYGLPDTKNCIPGPSIADNNDPFYKAKGYTPGYFHTSRKVWVDASRHKDKIEEIRSYSKASEEIIKEKVDPAAWINFDKKIVGYKAPYDLFKGRVKKGSIFSEYSPKKLVMYTKEHTTTGIATEIVHTWEPVYEPTEIILNIGTPRKVITIKDDATITAEGKSIPWKLIADLKNNMSKKDFGDTRWSICYPFVIIGCSTFSKEEITKVWDAFASLNKKTK